MSFEDFGGVQEKKEPTLNNLGKFHEEIKKLRENTQSSDILSMGDEQIKELTEDDAVIYNKVKNYSITPISPSELDLYKEKVESSKNLTRERFCHFILQRIQIAVSSADVLLIKNNMEKVKVLKKAKKDGELISNALIKALEDKNKLKH